MTLRSLFLCLCVITFMPLPAMAAEGHDHALSSDDIGLEAVAPSLLNLKDAVPWETFFKTTFKREEHYVKDYDLYEYFEVPHYPKAIQKMEGKTVRVKGYVMTYGDETVNEEFLISAIKSEGCGHYHGPGSLVVEVHAKVPIASAPPQPVIYEGILELPDDPKSAAGIFYRLKDAVPVE